MTATFTVRRGVLLIGLAVLAGLVWFGWVTRSMDRLIGDVAVLEQVLRAYGQDHGGDLPPDLNALIAGGYCSVNSGGEWLTTVGGSFGRVSDPGRFDIAWGTSAPQMDAEGKVLTTGQPIIRSTRESQSAKTMCESLSRQLARELHEKRAASRPADDGRQTVDGRR